MQSSVGVSLAPRLAPFFVKERGMAISAAPLFIFIRYNIHMAFNLEYGSATHVGMERQTKWGVAIK